MQKSKEAIDIVAEEMNICRTPQIVEACKKE